MTEAKLLLGAHQSIAGGVHQALLTEPPLRPSRNQTMQTTAATAAIRFREALRAALDRTGRHLLPSPRRLGFVRRHAGR